MKLILHIGIPKTGTTSIQKALYEERDSLSAQGVYLLKGLGVPNNKGFSSAFESYPNSYSWQGNHSQQSWKRMTKESIDAFRREVQDASQDHHTVLVTSEQMSRRYRETNIKQLGEVLLPLFSEFSVVCTVRDQIYAIPSLYWLSVRTGVEKRNLADYCRQVGVFQPHLHYDELADVWGSVFGRNNLAFTVFQESKKWDAVQDFFSSVVTVSRQPNSPTISPRRNKSGSIPQTRLLRLMNQTYPFFNEDSPESRKSLKSRKRKAVRFTSFLGALPGNVLDDELAREVVSHFRESNTRFAQSFLNAHYPFPEQVRYLTSLSAAS